MQFFESFDLHFCMQNLLLSLQVTRGPGKTIEKNPKSLNFEKFDLTFEARNGLLALNQSFF